MLTDERRREYNTYTMVCKRSGCSALVDRGRARMAAYKRSRIGLGPYQRTKPEPYATGDGCGSWLCSRHYSAGRFAASQRKMAAELRRRVEAMEGSGGEEVESESESEAEPVRRLICWQAGTDDTRRVWLLPAEAMLEAADAAESMVAAREQERREREARMAEGRRRGKQRRRN